MGPPFRVPASVSAARDPLSATADSRLLVAYASSPGESRGRTYAKWEKVSLSPDDCRRQGCGLQPKLEHVLEVAGDERGHLFDGDVALCELAQRRDAAVGEAARDDRVEP